MQFSKVGMLARASLFTYIPLNRLAQKYTHPEAAESR